MVILVSAVFILGFPRELPGSKEMRDKAIEEGQLPKKDDKLRGKLRDIIPATIQLLKNPVYMFNTLAVTAGSLFGGGVGAFIAKFAQLKFSVNPGLAGITLGVVFLVGASGTWLNYLGFLYTPRKLTFSVLEPNISPFITGFSSKAFAKKTGCITIYTNRKYQLLTNQSAKHYA